MNQVFWWSALIAALAGASWFISWGVARRLDATDAQGAIPLVLRGLGVVCFLAGQPLAMASLALFVLGFHQG